MAKSAAKAAPKSVPAKKPPVKKAKPAKADAVPTHLAPSLINVLPASSALMAAARDIAEWLPQLERQYTDAKKGGAVQMARAYVVLHRLKSRIDEILKPLDALVKTAKEADVPEAFDSEGVPTITLEEGFRITVAIRTLASIKPGQKEAAIEWLNNNEKGDIIQETINASTLSALAKELGADNIDLPEDIFTVARIPNTSVTQT